MRSGLRERQQIVVALQVAAVVAEALAAVARLIELVLLDHGAHRAIEQHDALIEQLLQPLDALAARRLVDGRDAERRRARRCVPSARAP